MTPINVARASGAKTYFTGKPCPAGHITDRVVSSRQCVICARDRTSAWRSDRADHVSDYQRSYIEKNRSHINKRNGAWRAQNPARVKLAKAADYERHKAKRLTTMKAWRSANPAKVRDAQARKVLAAPDQYRAYKRNYKVRKRSAPGSHTGDDIRMLLRAQSGKCAYCRIRLRSKYHVDHILALSNGGSNDRSNLQVLCAPCNQSKSAKDPIVFAQSLGMLL